MLKIVSFTTSLDKTPFRLVNKGPTCVIQWQAYSLVLRVFVSTTDQGDLPWLLYATSVVLTQIAWFGCRYRNLYNDDVIKWKHFPRYGPFVRGIHRSPVTRSFDVFLDLRLNKRLSKHSWGWWFEPSRPLWRHCNVKRVCLIMYYKRVITETKRKASFSKSQWLVR